MARARSRVFLLVSLLVFRFESCVPFVVCQPHTFKLLCIQSLLLIFASLRSCRGVAASRANLLFHVDNMPFFK